MSLLDEKLKSRGMNGVLEEPPVMVEIFPGERVPLRRTHETMQAVSVDFYRSTGCLSCSMDVFCIADVNYVICPGCRVISPVAGEFFEGRPIRRHGLGLGFTCESLFKMQSEILQERTKYGKQEEAYKGDTAFAYERRDRVPIHASHY